MNTDKMIRKILGNTKRGGSKDWDGDGVPNKKDCQPRNTMRQDDKSIKELPDWQLETVMHAGRLYKKLPDGSLKSIPYKRGKYKKENE